MTGARSKRWVIGGGAAVFFIIAGPLWTEFREPGNGIWNVSLIVLLVGITVSAFMLQRYFRRHVGEIGEARFDTRNKTNG